jgi:hypothetical protein
MSHPPRYRAASWRSVVADGVRPAKQWIVHQVCVECKLKFICEIPRDKTAEDRTVLCGQARVSGPSASTTFFCKIERTTIPILPRLPLVRCQ